MSAMRYVVCRKEWVDCGMRCLVGGSWCGLCGTRYVVVGSWCELRGIKYVVMEEVCGMKKVVEVSCKFFFYGK